MDIDKIDFLTLLNESNSTRNPSTNEITLNVPIFSEPERALTITTPCKITSNCNTIIRSKQIFIKSSNVSFSNLSFETTLDLTDVNNFSITNCTIKTPESTKFGFLINNSRTTSINKVEISGESKYGVFISKGSHVTVNELSVHDIKETLFVVRGDSIVKITKSKFFNTKCNCMNTDDNCEVEISDSLFDNSEMPTLYVSNTKCIVQNCQFKNTSQTLLILEKSNDFLVEKSFFMNAEIAGIYTENSKGIIKENKFTKLEGNGVNCFENSDVQVLKNDFFDLKYPAITVKNKSKALISDNKIENDEINGISIRDTLDVVIQNNIIKNVLNCGISISDSEKITILNNVFFECKVTAIESYNKSQISASKNKISNIDKYAFLAYTSGYIIASENEICDVKLAMVKLAFKGGGEFVKNKIVNCPKQRECQTSSNYFFFKNGDFDAVTNDQERSNEMVKFEEKFVDTVTSKLCLKCKIKPHNCFLLDCGHNVYCKECAEEAMKNNELCPLCRWNIDKISQGFDTSNDNSCIICMEKEPNAIVLPCGHLGVCSDCLENWFKEKKTCPVCRTDSCFYKLISNNVI